MKRVALAILFACASIVSYAQERLTDQIYMKSGGAAFTLDVFKVAKPNAPCVIWLCSGGWVSDHKDINPILAKAFNDQGMTVVEVVHGAQPRYNLNDIVPMIKRAVRYVHANATRFGIDPNRIGISGGSAGGHLSLMVGGIGDAGDPNAKDPVDKEPCTVNAVGVFMPPTDFLNWGKPDYMPFEEQKMAVFMPAFAVTKDTPKDKVKAIGKLMSPIQYVSPKFPPTLIIHGDKDDLVPIQQSKLMDEALGKAGVDHTLIVIEGGGHDAKTLLGGFPRLVQWFKDKLKA
ncbi:MAG: alpha/beta hydrolase [Armatimonadetes bacterium]|nr:alpha/beta hydrolase [Armatimonadota bacterium]